MRHLFLKSVPNEESMVQFGRLLGSSLCSYGFGAESKAILIYLDGDLGAGKTTICRGFLHAFGYQGVVKSPTYTLVESYNQSLIKIHHFDLYRLGSAEELDFIGIRDYFHKGSCCLVEWPDRGLGVMPAADINISITATCQGRDVKIYSQTKIGDFLIADMELGKGDKLGL